MSNFAQSWNRLIAAARAAAVDDGVSTAPWSWVTRVAALGVAEYRAQPTWMAWAIPGCGVAMLVALVAVVLSGTALVEPGTGSELVALADPLAGNSLAP